MKLIGGPLAASLVLLMPLGVLVAPPAATAAVTPGGQVEAQRVDAVGAMCLPPANRRPLVSGRFSSADRLTPGAPRVKNRLDT